MGGLTTRVATVGLLAATLAIWAHARPIAAPADVPQFSDRLPLAFEEWMGRDASPLDAETARVLAADEYVHRYYAPGRPHRLGEGDAGRSLHERVEMDIAYYARPQAGAAMHSPLNCLPGNGWQVVETRPMTMTVDGGTPFTVRRLVVDRKGYRVAMAYWFQNRGAIVANEYQQRFRLLRNGLHGEPTDAALVRVMVVDTAAGHAALEKFTRALVARMQIMFR